MSLRRIKTIAVLLFLISLGLLSLFAYLNMSIMYKNDEYELENRLTKERVSNGSVITNFHYYELPELLYGEDSVKLVKFEGNEAGIGIIKANLQVKGKQENLQKFLDNIHSSGKSEWINRIYLTNSDEKELMILSIEFLKSK